MGRRKELKYYGNHLLGDYLTENQAQMLLKLQKVSEDMGGIKELKNIIYVLSDEQIDEIIKNGTDEVVLEEERMSGTLSNLQTVGVSYMYVAKRLILGDSVGMGKTVQVAGLIKYLSDRALKTHSDFRVLYVTEKSLVKQSHRELIKFSGLYFHELYGEKDKIRKFTNNYELESVNVCGTHSLLKHPDFIKWFNDYKEFYGFPPFNMLVVDESGSVLTNETTAMYKGARIFEEDSEYVILMNAGSFENSLDKFKAQLDFVDSTLLFNKTEFQKRYYVYDWYGGRPTFNGKYKNSEDFKEKVLLRYLKRTRVGQGAKMIDCSAELIEVKPSSLQKEFLRKSAMPQMVLDCPPYFDSSVPFNREIVPKAGALLDKINELKEKSINQVLVYTTLKEPHPYLKEFLQNEGISVDIMNGSTSLKDRNNLISAFKQGSLEVLITNVQRGLNFGNCNHCIFYNYDGNPNNMTQFEGRITRDFDIINKHAYVIVTKGVEKDKLLSDVRNRAQASHDFAGSDFSMVLDLLIEREL